MPNGTSHSLAIGGQLGAGLALVAFYEDGWPDRPLARFTPLFFATRAVKAGGIPAGVITARARPAA